MVNEKEANKKKTPIICIILIGFSLSFLWVDARDACIYTDVIGDEKFTDNE